MDGSRRRRPQNHQPRLPLHNSDDGERRPDEEWRLDDETRQIGLKGVALARARLMGAESPVGTDRATGDRTGDRTDASGGDRRSAGRAA
jgi:hypothetical protein